MAEGYLDPQNERTMLLPPSKSKLDVEDVDVFDSKTDLREHSMLRGMKGYQLTPDDMEFLRMMLEEKMVANLKKQLEEVQQLLELETIAVAKASASRQAQQVLEKLPRWVKIVLGSTLAEVVGLDAEALLSLVSSQEVSLSVQRKKVHLRHMRAALENKCKKINMKKCQTIRRKKRAEEEMRLQKVFFSEQSKVQVLMTELSDLKSQLVQQELAYETLRNSSQVTTRIKGEEVTVPEEQQQDAKYHLRSRRKEGQKPENESGPKQDGKNRGLTARRHPATNQGTDRKEIPAGSYRPSSTSQSAAGKPAQLPQEDEKVPTRRMKQPTRKQKTMAATAVSQPGGAEEPQHPGLRMSKRIANRK